MNILDIIAKIHNWLSDKDFIWWPFSFLRPAPQDKITFKHTLTMTGCFGGLTFVFFTVFAIMNNAFSIESTVLTFGLSVGGFMAWFNVVTKPLWNRRASQLKGR